MQQPPRRSNLIADLFATCRRRHFGSRPAAVGALALSAAALLLTPALAPAAEVRAANADARGMAPAATPGPPGQAPAAGKTAQAKKAVGALVNAIRFDKRRLGEKHLGFASMAEHLLGQSYAQMSSAERSQFIADFQVLLIGTAFPKGHDLFRYLDGVLYGQVKEAKGRITLPSTIVVHRNVKKTEMQVEWVLVEEDGTLKVVDVVSMNDSTCDGIRDDEIAPLVREGGVAKLLSVLHERAAAVAKVGAK